MRETPAKLSRNSRPLEPGVSPRKERVLANWFAALLFTAGLAVFGPLHAHPHSQVTEEDYYEDFYYEEEGPRYEAFTRRYDDPGEIEPAEAFVRHALAMVGHPYRYGGERPGGFDCSGLVNYAAARVGLRLPRTSRELQTVGRRVRRSELRPGDLLFFHGRGGKLLHVGIYIGDDYFVHAPRAGRRVSVDDLQGVYYRRNSLQARRVRFETEREYYSMSSRGRNRAGSRPNDQTYLRDQLGGDFR